jgi:cell division protein FtsQ
MSPVAAPADRRFRRAHVKPARRRRWYAALKPVMKYGFVVSLVVAGLYRGGQVVTQARMLKIDTILVDGNVRIATADVLEMLGGLRGESILLSDLRDWSRHLQQSSWIKHATFRRSLPSTVEVLIEERTPIAVGRLGEELYIVDSQGVVLDEFGPVYADFDLPVVDGLSSKKIDPGGATDEQRAALAARVVAALAVKPTIARRISQIDVRDPENAVVILSGDSTVLYLGQDRFLQRVEAYLELGSTLRERVPAIDYIDLRFDEARGRDRRIYVRPAEGARSSLAAPPSAQLLPSSNTERGRSRRRR